MCRNMTISHKIRIAQAITRKLKWNYDLPAETLESRITINPVFDGKFSYLISQDAHLNNPTSAEVSSLREELKADVDQKLDSEKAFLQIGVDQKEFIKDTLTLDLKRLFHYRKPFKVVIDFSSPNIAKPFHFGHLRSTIIGNYIANINKFLRNDVIKLNYLGDWGVQFGILKIGLIDGDFSAERIAENPLKILHKAYVAANKKADENPELFERAKKVFYELEHADDGNSSLNEWRTFREYTLKELVRIYQRLGVTFDEYGWESDYSAKNIQPLIDKMKQKGVLKLECNNALTVVFEEETVPFIKYDGTSLYISRDTAAALDRYKRHKFDKMYYVVDLTQKHHFDVLKRILKLLDVECADKIEHVSFGRIHGMSTRKGEVQWLDDILNELKDKTETKQRKTITTKVLVGGEIADILGMSALIVNDLSMPRARHYKFSWDYLRKLEKCPGIKFQYTHCRLVSLEESCGATLPSNCDPTTLREIEALSLINQISRFEEALVESYNKLEPYILVQYLLDLCDYVNRAHKRLRVKGQDPDIASQRLLLFIRARNILNIGMKIIGLKPLDKM